MDRWCLLLSIKRMKPRSASHCLVPFWVISDGTEIRTEKPRMVCEKGRDTYTESAHSGKSPSREYPKSFLKNVVLPIHFRRRNDSNITLFLWRLRLLRRGKTGMLRAFSVSKFPSRLRCSTLLLFWMTTGGRFLQGEFDLLRLNEEIETAKLCKHWIAVPSDNKCFDERENLFHVYFREHWAFHVRLNFFINYIRVFEFSNVIHCEKRIDHWRCIEHSLLLSSCYDGRRAWILRVSEW